MSERNLTGIRCEEPEQKEKKDHSDRDAGEQKAQKVNHLVYFTPHGCRDTFMLLAFNLRYVFLLIVLLEEPSHSLSSLEVPQI